MINNLPSKALIRRLRFSLLKTGLNATLYPRLRRRVINHRSLAKIAAPQVVSIYFDQNIDAEIHSCSACLCIQENSCHEHELLRKLTDSCICTFGSACKSQGQYDRFCLLKHILHLLAPLPIRPLGQSFSFKLSFGLLVVLCSVHTMLRHCQ